MALGNNYQSNQNSNQVFEPSYYSRLRIKNPTDNLSLSFTFWRGTLKITLTDIGNFQDGKTNELGYIHLSPTKARLFAECVKRIIDNQESSDIYGIDTGAGETRGFIAIGRDMGKPYLVIAKVNKDGKYESSQRFNFNVDYNYLLKVHDLETIKCQKEYRNEVELDQFFDVLNDYARFASGALGASFYDIGRYEASKLSGMVRKIGIKVGAVDANSSYSGKQNSFFDNAEAEYDAPSQPSSNKKSSYQSIDDLENELG